MISKEIGDACTGAKNEVILPNYAECRDGSIQCEFGYMSNTTLYCVRDPDNPRLPEGAPCTYDTDCAGDMWCGFDAVCVCRKAIHKFDSDLNYCVRKEYLDSCSIDSDCAVKGENYNGYTFNSGQCNYGVCDCGVNKEVIVSHIDKTTGELVNKTICVLQGPTTDLDVGDQCTVDPVYDSDRLVRTCMTNTTCVRCPEDATPVYTGICRKFANCQTFQHLIISKNNYRSFISGFTRSRMFH